MKFQHLILYLISVVTLAGCGVSESEHQRVNNELQTTKDKSTYARTDLDTAKQKQDSRLAEQERIIQGLNASIKDVKASNSEKLAKIDQIMSAEETAMAKADEAYKAGDKTKALNLYKGVLRDFPSSSIVSLAVSKVNELTSSIAKDKRIAEAPYRERLARAQTDQRSGLPAEFVQKTIDNKQIQEYKSGYAFGLKIGQSKGRSARHNGLLSMAAVEGIIERYVKRKPENYADGFRAGFKEAYDKETTLY